MPSRPMETVNKFKTCRTIMEGNVNFDKVWKNKRRKSLYNMEYKDVGLLYRKIYPERNEQPLTRSRTKDLRKKLTVVEDGSHCDEGSKVSIVTNQQGLEETRSNQKPASQAKSKVAMAVLDKRKVADELCMKFIGDLKKHCIGEDGSQEPIDKEAFQEIADIFFQALHEPPVIEPYYSVSDRNKAKALLEEKLKLVNEEYKQYKTIDKPLADDKENLLANDTEQECCVLDDSQITTYLSNIQRDFINDIGEAGLTRETSGITAIAETIVDTEATINSLQEKLNQEVFTMDSEVKKLLKSLNQTVAESPRTLIQQLKSTSAQ